MPTDTLDYTLIGEDLQALIVTLDPGEAAVAEAGAMMYMQQGIEMGTQLSMRGNSGGIFDKLFEAGKRALTGDSFFVTYFTNTANVRQDVAFAAPYPGRVVPVELGEHGGQLLCQKDSFLCAARGVAVDIAFTRRLGAGLFGGEGFILQRLSSDNGRGQAFLHAGGTTIERRLNPGETLRVDIGCLVAFEPTVDYDIQMVPGFKNMLFGGEGLFFARLTGPGTVWLQTLPFSRLADRIIASAPKAGGRGRDEGSILGGSGGYWMEIIGSNGQTNRMWCMERLAANNPYFPFVTVDPDRLSGEPAFRGTRVLVSSLFDYLRAGYDLETFLDHFEGVSQEQAEGVLSLASQDAVAALRAA